MDAGKPAEDLADDDRDPRKYKKPFNIPEKTGSDLNIP